MAWLAALTPWLEQIAAVLKAFAVIVTQLAVLALHLMTQDPEPPTAHIIPTGPGIVVFELKLSTGIKTVAFDYSADAPVQQTQAPSLDYMDRVVGAVMRSPEGRDALRVRLEPAQYTLLAERYGVPTDH